MNNEEVDRLLAQAVREAEPNELYKYRFAALVAAAERERVGINSIHTCHPECQRPVCVAVREAVAAEREACAKLLDEMAAADKLSNYYQVAALRIRERGAP
jgi:hypothetical protein